MLKISTSLAIFTVLTGLTAQASADGSQMTSKPYSALWLGYKALNHELQTKDAEVLKAVISPGSSTISQNARDELVTAVRKLTGTKIPITQSIEGDGTVIIGTVEDLGPLLPTHLAGKVDPLNNQGYLIQSTQIHGKQTTIIASKSESGVLYGTFHLIRLIQTGEPIDHLSLVDQPAIQIRMLDHWDNLDGSIERGYGGKSLWKWKELPGTLDPRLRDYARLCASIGINGVALNNVNADPRILRDDYLHKVTALAGLFRNWGIRVFITANFAAPMRLSKTAVGMHHGSRPSLKTADPLNPAVQAWWKKKVDEIYALIPDFGGFLVKADSEGMKGPGTYGRTQVDGANMLADALATHGGTLIWRAFIHGRHDKDPAMDAYHLFKPYDGKFRKNVFIQVKNGPLDFQPCPPFSPLFGSMPKTDLAMEFQIAKEYLGQGTTAVYLGPMWSEILNSDTYAHGKGSTVAKVIDGSLYGHKRSCIAGVANTGDGPEWCGSVLNQANWYAFGRLAWNPTLDPESIADEWIRMTFDCDAGTRETIRQIMMESYVAYVDYTMPLGLNFLCAKSDHYTPNPAKRVKFHHADAMGLGFDRTTHGSNYVSQYHSPLQKEFNNRKTTPLKYLLWFHHVPWRAELRTGRTLWQELEHRYDKGVTIVDQMAKQWQSLKGKLPPDVYASEMKKLHTEQQFARMWRDRCLGYFSAFDAAAR